jgi:hypothetical protein
MAVSEWLWMQEPDLYSDGIFKLVLRRDKCIDVIGDYVKKQYFSGRNEVHLTL